MPGITISLAEVIICGETTVMVLLTTTNGTHNNKTIYTIRVML